MVFTFGVGDCVGGGGGGCGGGSGGVGGGCGGCGVIVRFTTHVFDLQIFMYTMTGITEKHVFGRHLKGHEN